MFDADFRSVLHLLRRATHHRAQPGRSHRTCRTDLPLASDFRTGNGGIAFKQVPYRTCSEQKGNNALFVRMVNEMPVIVKHCRNDSCSTVGRRGDDSPTAGVFLRHRQSEQIHPCRIRRFEHRIHAFLVSRKHITVGGKPCIHFRCPAGHIQTAGQHGLRRMTSALYATTHHPPHVIQFAANLHRRLHGRFVGPHNVGNTHMVLLA